MPAEDSLVLALTYAGGQLQASWAAQNGATSYDFEVLDAAGNPLSATRQNAINGLVAVVAGDLLANGAVYTAHVRVASPPTTEGGWFASTTITLLKITSPSNLQMAFHADGLLISWDPILGAEAYNVRLLDGQGNAVAGAAQNGLNQPQVLVPPQLIADGATYTAQVQAIAFSTWSSLTNTVDTFSPMLRDLELQLNNATDAGTLMLDSTSITDSHLLALIGSLTDPANPTLSISNPHLSRGEDNASLQLVGAVTLPGNVQVESVTALFTAPGEQLAMQMVLPLGAWSFAQSFPELAGSFFDSLEISNPTFVLASGTGTYNSADGTIQTSLAEGLNFVGQVAVDADGTLAPALEILGAADTPVTVFGPITVDGQTHPFHLSSDPLAISPNLSLSLTGMAPLLLNTVAIGLESQLAPEGWVEARAMLHCQTSFAGNQRIDIQLPVGPRGWAIEFIADPAAPLTLATVLPDAGGSYLTSTLLPPKLVSAINTVALTQLAIQFAPGNIGPTLIDLTLSTTSSWEILSTEIVPQGLSLTGLAVSISIAHYPAAGNYVGETQYSGTIGGSATVGGLSVLMSLQIPPALGMPWVLSVAATNPALPSVAGMQGLISDTDLQATLPSDFASISGLILADLEITFDPFAAPLANVLINVWFMIGYNLSWPIVSSATLNNIWLNFNIANPLVSAQRQIWWMAVGDATIGGAAIMAQVESPTADDPNWYLELTGETPLLPRLDTMLDVSGDSTANNQVPTGIVTTNTYLLAGLTLAIDPSDPSNNNKPTLQWLDVQVQAYSMWDLISDVFSVGSLDLALRVTPSQSPSVRGYIAGELDIVGVPIELTASTIDETQPATWVLEGQLEADASVSLNDLVTLLINTTILPNAVLPTSFPEVALVAAWFSYTVASGAFSLSGTSTVTWNVPFASQTMPIAAIGARLEVGAAATASTRPYTLTATGMLSFATLQASMTFTTSNTTIDTVLTGSVSQSDIATLSIGSVAGGLTKATLSQTLPNQSTYSPPALASASVYLNLTKNVFLLYGQVAGTGTAALFVRQLADGTWGFAFVFALQAGWTFGSLSSTLTPLDSSIAWSGGYLGLVSFDDPSTETNTQPVLSGIALPDAALAPLAELLPRGKGVTFSATLQFTNTPFSLVPNVVSLAGPYAISGWIPADPNQATFSATLGTLTILNKLSFAAITLSYALAAPNSLVLTGTIVVAFDSTDLSFPASLLIDGTSGFVLATAKSTDTLQLQFGTHGVSLQNLNAILRVTYSPRQVDASLSGTVNFYSQPTIAADPAGGNGGQLADTRVPSFVAQAAVVIQGGSPWLAVITLDPAQPLAIGDLLNTTFNTDIWSKSALMNIAFIGGSMYYADCADDANQSREFNGVVYKDGYHLTSTFKLFSSDSSALGIDLAITSSGITATVQMLQPIDLGFAGFTDINFAGQGPSISITTVDTPRFELASGLTLLGEHFAQADISATTNGLRATVVYAGTISYFQNTGFTFTYSPSQGFQVERWPWVLGTIAEFEAMYEQVIRAYQSGECLPIGDLVFSQALSTNFVLRPSMSGQNGTLTIVLNGRYEISIKGQTSPFLLVALPTLNFPVPSGITLSNLPSKLAEFILDSATAIIEMICKDPVKLTAFVSVVVGKQLTQAALNRLLCYDYGAEESPEVVEAAQEAAGTAQGAAAEAQAASTPGGATGAAELAGGVAEGGAIIAAGEGGGLTAAGAAVVAGIFAVIASSTHGSGGQPPAMISLSPPSFRSISHDASSIIVNWNGTAAPGGYALQLVNSTNTIVATAAAKNYALGAAFPIANLSPGAYQVQIQALGDSKSYTTSTWQTSNPITLLTPPTHVNMSYVNGLIVVTWEATADGASGYRVNLIGSDNALAAAPEQSTGTTANFDPSNLAPGSYSANVVAVGDNSHIDSATSVASTPLVRLASPSGVTFQYDRAGKELAVNWQSTTNPDSFFIALVDTSNNNLVVDSRTVAGSQRSCSFSDALITGQAGSYQIRVQALGSIGFIDSAPAWSADTLDAQAAPTNVTLVYDPASNALTISWDVVAAATGYLAQLISTGDDSVVLAEQQVAQPAGQQQTRQTYTVNIAGVVGEQWTYGARVRAIGDANSLDGPFGVAPNTFVGLATPENLAQSYDADSKQLTASWLVVAGASSYRVRIIDTNHANATIAETLVQPTTVPTDQTLVWSTDLSQYFTPAGASYQIWVEALGNGYVTSAAAQAPTTTVLLAAPQVSSMIYDETTGIIVTWAAPVPGAEVYVVEFDQVSTPYPNQPTIGWSMRVQDPQATSAVNTNELPAGVTSGSVRVIGNGIDSMSATAPAPLTRLAPPTITALSYADSQITVAWQAVGDAPVVDVQLIDENDLPISSVVFQVDTATSTALGAAGELDPATYRAAARASAPGTSTIASVWGPSNQTLGWLAAPAVTEAVYDFDKISVFWTTPIENAVGYTAVFNMTASPLVVYTNNNLDPYVAHVSDPNATSAAMPTPPPGTYSVVVQANAANGSFADSAWAEAPAPAIVPAPLAITVTPTLGTLGHIAVDSKLNRVYVGDNEGVFVLDGNTMTQITQVGVVGSIGPITANSATGLVYIGAANNMIQVFNPDTNIVVESIPTTTIPKLLIAEPIRNRIFAFDGEGFLIIEGNTNEIITTLGERITPDHSALDPVAGRIYITYDSHGLAVYDIDSGQSVSQQDNWAGGQRITAVAVNSKNNHLLLANQDQRSIQVLDGATLGVLATIPIPAGNDADAWLFDVAVDPETNRIYVASGDQSTQTSSQNSFAVFIIDGDSHQVLERVPLDAQPTALVVDPISHCVYATTGDHVSLIAPWPPFVQLSVQKQQIAQNEATTLFITLTNGNGTLPLTEVGFSITLGPELMVATPNSLVSDFAGTIRAEPRSRSITFSYGTVEALQVCTAAVAIQAIGEGIGQISFDGEISMAEATTRQPAIQLGIEVG